MQLRSMVTRAVIGTTRGHDPYECRDCGASLERDPGVCPVCGSRAVTALPV